MAELPRVPKSPNLTFTYNIKEKSIDLSPELLAEFKGMPSHFDNIPYSFANAYVHEDDIPLFNEMYTDIDNGETFATADFRIKQPLAWNRVCLFHPDLSTDTVLGIVQNVSVRYNYLNSETQKKELEANLRIQKEFEALQLLNAIKNSADFIISVNFTKDTYYFIDGKTLVNDSSSEIGGNFEKLFDIAINGIPERARAEYINYFAKENIRKAYFSGENYIYLEHEAYGSDKTVKWVSTHLMFTENPFNDDIVAIIVTRNINERLRKEAQQKKALKDALEAAEKANKAKSTFLFNASHDIRTPMNAIQGFSQILKNNLDNPEIVKDAVTKIEKSSETLNMLLSGVLELSRIESGKEDLNLEPTNLIEHSKNLYNMFNYEVSKLGIELTDVTNVKDTTVLCDPLKLTQVGMNMLSNAKKFTRAGGKIEFGIIQLDDVKDGYATYRCFVKDTGIGMSKEFQKKAFEQFERERSSTNSGVVGSGLGMAIIKKTVDLMGGECVLESELGKGTLVAAIIKFKIADKSAPAAAAAAAAAYESEIFRGKRVLLVEDNDFNREIARYILEGIGLEIDEAENGAVAVEKLLNSAENYFDLVLMDIQMPIMDGYTATKEIRNIENKKTSQIPIIAMTANAFSEDREKCIEVGMNGHIAKPIDTKLLIQELAKILIY